MTENRTIGGMRSQFQFQPINTEDLPLVHAWLNAPHVRHWFGEPKSVFARIENSLGESWIEYYRADAMGKPTGFTQVYDSRRAPRSNWPPQPLGSVGIDFFLGEPEALGQGLGTALVEDFVRFIRAIKHPPRIVADPAPDNVRSVRALRHAGFSRDPESGLYVLGHV